MNHTHVQCSVKQRGSALIVAIMMMMALGLLGLNTVNQHLQAALALARSEKAYFQSWELAVSSLNWGLVRDWQYRAVAEWQCVESSGLHSCVKPSDVEGQYVLRGEGKARAVSASVYLYHLVSLETAAGGTGHFKALTQGWLDFCPLKDEALCDG